MASRVESAGGRMRGAHPAHLRVQNHSRTLACEPVWPPHGCASDPSARAQKSLCESGRRICSPHERSARRPAAAHSFCWSKLAQSDEQLNWKSSAGEISCRSGVKRVKLKAFAASRRASHRYFAPRLSLESINDTNPKPPPTLERTPKRGTLLNPLANCKTR